MAVGDGLDWANAYAGLPTAEFNTTYQSYCTRLERGATYYIADGQYPKYFFDDPVQEQAS